MIDYPPHDEAWAVSAFDTYLRVLELHRQYYWILDRFHISTISHQQLERGRNVDLDWIDRRLAALGFVLIHLRRAPETFEDARAHRLTYSENPDRYSDLGKYVREQELMEELVAASQLPSLSVDVSDGDVPRIANEILDWVEAHDYFFPRS